MREGNVAMQFSEASFVDRGKDIADSPIVGQCPIASNPKIEYASRG